ncbi:MAG: penicillin-insensitive murein endopeptidase [Myxococcales bacterium]
MLRDLLSKRRRRRALVANRSVLALHGACVLAWSGCGAHPEPRPQASVPASAPVIQQQEHTVAALGSAVTVGEQTPAPAEPAAVPALDPLAALPAPSTSTSFGSPTNGRLEGGVALPLQAQGLRYNDRRSENARFATVEVIQAVLRAARTVADEFPASELVVNDIGLEHGGKIAHHGSHRAGRDADILFYLLGDDGRPTPSVGAPIDPEGIGFDYKDLSVKDDDVRVHFDAPRTWRFVRALIEDQAAPLQRIFVVEHLRSALLEEATRSKAPADVVARFADLTCQPSYPHDDHLHVRWYCSEEDLGLGCEDLPPLYPWRSELLAAHGVTPVLAKRGKSVDPAPIETNADAERAVQRQKPHPDVLKFLARRKAWEKQPHPGREYCR